MNIKPEEVSSVIRRQIEAYSETVDLAEVGEVIQIGDGVARIYGLDHAMAMELIEFPNDVYGMALNLEEDTVAAVLLGEESLVKEGDQAKRTHRIAQVPVGEALLGRVVNALGQPLDGKGPIDTDKQRNIERVAAGIVYRQPVDTPLQTGLKCIDAMTPIGRGQRELIIGDRQTGKTAIAIDTILNQKDTDVICIYVAIGQRASTTAQIIKVLEEHGAMDYTVVVSACASDPAAQQYIAPYAGCAMGEEFMDQGRDVLVVYDDLTRHAEAYRQVSLLLRRPPGREAFPGDVFYLHSRLLERAVRMEDLWVIARKDAAEDADGVDGLLYHGHEGREVAEQMLAGFDAERYEVRQITEKDSAVASLRGKWAIFPKDGIVALAHCVWDDEESARKAFAGRPDKDELEVRKKPGSGGSLTALPIIETKAGDISAYIPTNVISITDGQIFLESDLFYQGVRPAMNVGTSVSRVGGAAQIKAMKSVAGRLRIDLAQYREMAAFAQFGSDLDKATRQQIARGERTVEILKQDQYSPMPVELQVVSIFAATRGHLDDLQVEDVRRFERELHEHLTSKQADLLAELREKGAFDDELERRLEAAIVEFKQVFSSSP